MPMEKISHPAENKKLRQEVNMQDTDQLINENPSLSCLFEKDKTEYVINEDDGKFKSHGCEYSDIPRMRSYIRIASIIREALPPKPEVTFDYGAAIERERLVQIHLLQILLKE